MRRSALLLALALVAGSVALAARAMETDAPEVSQGSTAEARVEPGCSVKAGGYRCLYGPIELSGGGSARTPYADVVDALPESGYITSMRATLVDPQGNAIPRHAVHLHHAVWLNPARRDTTCRGLPDRFFASGKERTKISLPDGFGYHWSNEPLPAPYSHLSHKWLLNYHLDAMHSGRYEVYIRLDLDFTPESEDPSMSGVTPVWMDVRNCTMTSEFNVPKNGGRHGKYKTTWTFLMPDSGRFVAMAGHLHDGGLKLKLRNITQKETVFVSRPTYSKHDRWDLRRMTSFSDAAGPTVSAGDKLHLIAVYDDSRRWKKVMGIMSGAFVPDGS
ncbi:MAG TPA: hypothetical protein VFA00_02770 [Actinomycetota bacterium]|nr:hypothetical protein [Actinomycetota bacterium]